MRLVLILAALMPALTLLSQPTIGTADLPQSGTVYLRANALPPFNAGEAELAGEDVQWDFSGLSAEGDVETEYFPMSDASLTTQFLFSDADHFTAFDLPDFGEEFSLPISGATVYREFGSDAYRTIGLGLTTDLFDLPVTYEDEEELLPLPMAYGAFVAGSSAFAIDLEGIVYYASEQIMDIEVDAWGTLVLPGGEFECLRVKRTFAALDSVNLAAAEIGFSIPREGTVYEWYAPGEGMPVLSVQTFVDIPAVWQFKPSETDQVDAVAAPVDWKLGPSPLRAGDRLGCAGLAGRTLRVTDALGRTLFEGQPDGHGSAAGLSTAGWSAGTVLVTDVVTGRSARVVIR